MTTWALPNLKCRSPPRCVRCSCGRSVFEQAAVESLDQETLFTIQRFFENDDLMSRRPAAAC